MNTNQLKKLLSATLLACAVGLNAFAQVAVPGTYKNITIDGSFNDWTGVPLAYTAAEGPATAIQYENVYIANDSSNLYLQVTLYTARPDAFANTYDNIFINSGDQTDPGYPVGGIDSDMLIQWGGGYQEKDGGFNEGSVNNLGWNVEGSADGTQFEMSISLGAVYANDGTQVFTNNTVEIVLEGDDTGYNNVEFAPPSGGLVYTFAPAPSTVSTNVPLVTLANTSWQVNASGTDLGTNWLQASYDDTQSGWSAGDGLFGYTPQPGAYPAIKTPLANTANTYYFSTDFVWTNNTANLAFIVTNYLSDGAVFYLNGVEARRIRMPSGTITYSTLATGTNSPVGQPDVFGLDGSTLVSGTNVLDVEVHQAPADNSMVFGLSLTEEPAYPITLADPTQPANQTVQAGQPVTFTSDVFGSGPSIYQWYFDGTNAIAGANGPSYTIPLTLTNNAGTYSLAVSNSFSGLTTRAALLTVTSLPVVITNPPTSQVVVEGTPVTFTVGVSATPVVQYQWNYGGAPITGATNATYAIADCFPTNAGAYTVTISNPASTTNSSVATLTVLKDTVPPNLLAISGGSTQVTVTFGEPVDPVTAGNPANYGILGGITITSATPNPSNPAQVVLTTSAGLNWGTVYTLTVNGVQDLFGNAAHVRGNFIRGITIDGSFNDWVGIAPIYTTAAPSGNTNAADFNAIYVYDDANYYYFRVTLWTDINPSAGQFPYYVNMFFDTDNNPSTGYTAFGFDMLIQSGFGHQEKDGNFNDDYGINNLGWLSLPASPGTNFEFQISKAATFGQDGTPVFTTNLINFLFQGQTPGFILENTAPTSGELSYTNGTPVPVPSLPPSNLGFAPLGGGHGAISWDLPGILQESSSVTGPWTNLPAATPPFVLPLTGPREFFRVAQ